jgi:hypothetical protein
MCSGHCSIVGKYFFFFTRYSHSLKILYKFPLAGVHRRVFIFGNSIISRIPFHMAHSETSQPRIVDLILDEAKVWCSVNL